MQHRRPASTDLEITIDLSARELLEPAPAACGDDEATIEVADIGEVDPALRTGSFAADPTATSGGAELVEIELTAEQIEELLGEV